MRCTILTITCMYASSSSSSLMDLYPTPSAQFPSFHRTRSWTASAPPLILTLSHPRLDHQHSQVDLEKSRSVLNYHVIHAELARSRYAHFSLQQLHRPHSSYADDASVIASSRVRRVLYIRSPSYVNSISPRRSASPSFKQRH